MSYCDKPKMLRMIVDKPRVMRDFSEGSVAQTVSARHLERYAEELIAEGLVIEEDGKFYPTDAGTAEVNKPTTFATSRAICAASSRDTYKPQWAATRVGADQHKQYRSLGF